VPEPDLVYRKARETLEPVLRNHGFELAAECYYPEAFGSAHAEFKRTGLRVRLVWDGKDRWLWMSYAPQEGDAHPKPGTYRSIGSPAEEASTPALVLRDGPTAERRIRQLTDQLVAVLDREAAV